MTWQTKCLPFLYRYSFLPTRAIHGSTAGKTRPSQIHTEKAHATYVPFDEPKRENNGLWEKGYYAGENPYR